MKNQSLDVEVEIIFLERSLGFSKELSVAIAKSKFEFIQKIKTGEISLNIDKAGYLAVQTAALA